MNFFQGRLVGTEDNVSIEFGLDKIALPKEKVDMIVNLDKYLNTDKEIVFGIRPEDIHDEDVWLDNPAFPQIEIKVDVVEALGSETILYAKTRRENEEDDGEKSIAEDISNIVAKVDSRSNSKAGDTVRVALDIVHCHLFDKDTEVTILASSEENKAEIIELQAKKEAEAEIKRAEKEAEAAEEAAKIAAIEEKKREKRNRKNKGEAEIVENEEVVVVEETETVENATVNENADNAEAEAQTEPTTAEAEVIEEVKEDAEK